MTRNCRYGRTIVCGVACETSFELDAAETNGWIKRCLVTGERFYAFCTTFSSEYVLRMDEESRKMIVDTN